ncbi:MAG: single-stranded DNA-binding protein [Clostridiales Family XIII bacterium]|jgi:single-strand DNA-binding protein|nr:single-stranded DNA-binding protein [Clostridiales Family XIII bacterium]
MNNVNLIGRLTKDPELRHTNEGRSICQFTLAIDDTFSKEDRSDFIRVTVFGNQAENCEKYLRKGFLAGVSGRMRSDIYTDSAGIKRYPISVTGERVQFLQWPSKESEAEKAADQEVA